MTPDAIASFLAPKGPLARAVARFEPRAGQVDMAQTVGRAIESGGHVVIEAGTGTGKTFGYLVPALLAARGPVVVATATRTLQDQIFETDLPRLLPLFPGIKAVRLKGRANYLCPFRMKQWVATVDVRVMTLEERLRLRGLIDWSSRTVEGDLAEFHDLSEEDPWRRSITSTRENCLGRECPDFVECPFNRVRLAAMEAGLIVTNHHLLLADLALKEGRFGQILPEAAMVVVDEAHNLPPLTSVVFGDSVSTWQTRDLIGDLRKLGIEAGVDEVVLREADRVHQATEEVIHAWPSGVEEGKEEIGLLRERLPKLPEALGDWHQALSDLADLLDRRKEGAEEIAKLAERGQELADRVGSLSQSSTRPEVVHWAERGARSVILHGHLVEVAGVLRQTLFARYPTVVMTSATLTTAGKFDHFLITVGLDRETTPTLVVPGSFDYPNRTVLYCPPDLPDPKDPRYIDQLLPRMGELVRATEGHALLLFTSHRHLTKARAWFETQDWDFPVLAQGQGSRRALLERFRATPESVLLATGSFWEGVDIQGRSLSCLIIDKLPFPSPDDPVLRARMAQVKERGRSDFVDVMIPLAVTQLRQGAGRLMRHSNDFGVLMICDPRLRRANYGRIFIESLPPMKRLGHLAGVARWYEGIVAEHEAGDAGSEADRGGGDVAGGGPDG